MKYFFRDERIMELARGKSVLHLGCVGFTDLEISDRVALSKESLHYSLSNITQVIGVDCSRDAVEYFKMTGVFTNVIYGDVEKLHEVSLNGPFEVIVVGDIIEHLSNPGLMLDGIRTLCHSASLIVITTPNCFGLLGFIKHVLNRFVEGKEHVMTFNEQNIVTLCTRHGYEVTAINTCYQKHALSHRFFHIGKLFFQLFPRLGGTLFLVAKPIQNC